MNLVNPILPKINPTWKSKAMVDTGRMHGVSRVFSIDHKSLERNKYAPWGRGHNTSLGETIVSFA